MDFGKYSEDLSRLIDNPSAGLLLDAEIDYDSDGNEVPREGAVFLLTSGKYRRKFVSLWELFDHPDELKNCVNALVARAVGIGREHHFNTIVTCTPTAREILHHVQPLLEKEMGHELLVSDFGHYPLMTSGDFEPHAFRSRQALIFTDVMASGTLVREMAARVIRTGGEVIAVLCVVLSDETLAGQVDQERVLMPLNHQIAGRPTHAWLYPLTTYGLPNITEPFDPNKVRRIDFISVFPEFTPPAQTHQIPPIVGKYKMLSQLRATQALAAGFFRADGRHFTLGVRVEQLLAPRNEPATPNTADELWEAIWMRLQDLSPDIVLVSTFKKDDLIFAKFISDGLKSAGREPVRLVLKRELGDSPHLHHALFRHVGRVRNKDLLLIRAAATTSEEMRSLTALLAGEHVKSITVICLVNRMGVYAASFVHRIRQLVTGGFGEEPDPAKQAKFEFIPVYNFNDLRTDDLQRMHERVTGAMEKFSRSTDLAHFRHLAETFARAMAPRSVHTYAYESGEAGSYEPLVGGPFAVDGHPISLPEAAAACAEQISRHRTDLAITLVKEAQRADAFLHVAGLVVADIDYLRLSGQLGKVRDAIHERITSVRAARFGAEHESNVEGEDRLNEEELSATINHCLDLETHLLFAAGILSHFDKSHAKPLRILEEVLFADRHAADWQTHPQNLGYHFRDLRNYWLTTFLLHAAHPDLYGQNGAQELRRVLSTQLRERFNELLAPFTQADANEEHDQILLRNRIREMMNLLLVDLGTHTHREWHHRIRYLQTHVLRDSDRHSPLWTALKKAEADFKEFIDQDDNRLVADRLPRRIREAQNAALTLREVAEVARRLAFYPSHAIADQLQPLFADRTVPYSFHSTVAQLVLFLEQCQKKPPQTEAECADLKTLLRATRLSIFEPGSPLRRALLSFCVPLYATMLDALIDADARLATEELRDVWKVQIAKLQNLMEQGDELYALIDPQLLHEILRNVFSNVRYNISAYASAPGALSERVRMEINEIDDFLPEPEGSPAKYFTLTVEAQGVSYSENIRVRRRSGSTLEDHQARVREFGGSLEIGDGEGGTGCTTVLKVLSRQLYARFHKTELQEAQQARI